MLIKASCGSLGRYGILLWKNFHVYWRSPGYNSIRFIFTIAIAFVFGTVFWRLGLRRWVPRAPWVPGVPCMGSSGFCRPPGASLERNLMLHFMAFFWAWPESGHTHKSCKH